MKINVHKPGKSRRGILEVDLAIAMVILAVAILPLAFSFAKERQVLRVDYCRAVADEVVDGEMEILAAGAWKNFPDGSSAYKVQSRAAANLPAGCFELTKNNHHLRLAWLPDKHLGIGVVAREMNVP